MKGIEYLKSEDCPNIKAGMNLTEIQLYVIAGILEAYHKKQLLIQRVSNTEGKLLCEDCNKANRYLMFRVCEPCLIKGKYLAK